jgi:hypothetical protein
LTELLGPNVENEMNFEHMNAIQRRLHNAACVLGADGDEYGFEKLQRDAIAEIEHLREAVRSARADEAHCWASRVDTLAAQLRDSDARYMALLKAVADGVAMQPAPRIVVDLGPNVAMSGDQRP